jgi:hypothetical protein
MDPGLTGALGMETLFHEAMHQFDDAIYGQLSEVAREQKKKVPGDLSHAMIFYTAGEAVRAVIPGHQTYAETRNFWTSTYVEFKPLLDSVWKPYLDGKGRLSEVVPKLIR